MHFLKLEKCDRKMVEDKPLVSIIVPVYNVESYIRRCLESIATVIRKSDDREIEIICVDDGSDDKSGAICDEYALKYKNIKVYHNKNQGVSRARNFGLHKANGTYIAWCDSDDFLDEKWYEYVVYTLRSEDVDGVVIGYTKKYNNKEKNIVCETYGLCEQKEYIKLLSADDKIKSYLYIHILKKEILSKCKMDFNLNTYEDYDLLTQTSLLMRKIYIINKPLYYYTFRKSSITNTSKPEDLFNAMKIAKKRCEIYQLKGIPYSKAGYWKTIMIYCIKSAYDKQEYCRYKTCIEGLKNTMIDIALARKLNLKYKVCLLMLMVFPRNLIGKMWGILK